MMKDMTNAEAIEMMNRCKHEIANLRAEIDRLAPKAHAYDNIASILRLLPQPSRGMGEDVVWVLEKRIRELTPAPAKQPATAAELDAILNSEDDRPVTINPDGSISTNSSHG